MTGDDDDDLSTPDRTLRILVADEDTATLQDLSDLLRGLGHDVTQFAISVQEAAQVVAAEDPDVAVVRLDADDQHALALISEISECASGPVIALAETEETEFITNAAARGVFAWARPLSGDSIQGAIEVAVRRHAETEELTEKVDQLENALNRRAVIERAKGILMERHGLDERAAFELLRSHARDHNRKVLAVARAVIDGCDELPRED